MAENFTLSFSLQFLSIFLHSSGSIVLITQDLIWVSGKVIQFPPTQVEHSANFGQRWWRQKWKKSPCSSRGLREARESNGRPQKSWNNRELLKNGQKLRDILNIVYWPFCGLIYFFLDKNYCYSEFFTVSVKMSKPFIIIQFARSTLSCANIAYKRWLESSKYICCYLLIPYYHEGKNNNKHIDLRKCSAPF